MKRTVVAVLVVPLLLLAACGGGGGSNAASSSTGDLAAQCPVGAVAKASSKPVQITMWHSMTRANQDTLQQLTDEFNASHPDIHVNLVNQTSYADTLTKFKAALGGGDLPDLVQIQDVDQRLVIDSGALLPAQACIDATHFDESAILPRIRSYYTVQGVQWAMPFSVSNPILYFNKKAFEKAGLDPNNPPKTLDDLRAASQQLVASGATKYGLALKEDPWYFEEWLAMAGQPYADHSNGRDGRATKVLFDEEAGQTVAQWMAGMAKDQLAEGVPNTGFDNLFALGNEVAGMTMDTSAALGTISQVLGSGQYPNVELGAAALPGPGTGGTIVAGSALYLVNRSSAARQEAAFEFASFLAGAQSQSTWAAGTGYIPIRTDATTLAPISALWAQNPLYRIAFDQIANGADTNASAGPVIGAMEPVRDAVVYAEQSIFQGTDPIAALQQAAQTANAAIADYESRVRG